ncbi:MAG TPA: cyclic pyranopterin monophosphate synthase MoaC [Candidatus Baltobacteraceae bacterium]|nr:cyclic pyranopterin monophosphate synthase MoaC [Candidatus Baltobacteraceae bacterium]
MVDVSEKAISTRAARAEARVRMSAEARAALQTATLSKGDAFVAAQLAGIMAAKQTPALIPLAHPISPSVIDVAARTGVEMEAMVAAAVAALTVYDMVKGIERGVAIEEVVLLEKTGGRHDWRRDERA